MNLAELVNNFNIEELEQRLEFVYEADLWSILRSNGKPMV